VCHPTALTPPPLPGPVLGFGVGLDSCTDNSFSITVKLVEDNKLILVINSKLIKKIICN